MQKKPRHEFKVTFICCICRWVTTLRSFETASECERAKWMSESVLIHDNHWKMVTRCAISPSTCQLWRFTFSETIKSISFEHFSHNTIFCSPSAARCLHSHRSWQRIRQQTEGTLCRRCEQKSEHNWKCVTSATTEARFNERNLFNRTQIWRAHKQMNELSPVSCGQYV